VAGHYLLDKTERNYLARKVSSDEKAKERRAKLIFFKELKNQIILLDGYNVLITLESVLHHPDTILESDDGVLRDTKAVFGKYRPHEDTLNVCSAVTHHQVDRELSKNSTEKVIATSDGPLMDKVKKVVDLPGLIRNKRT